MATTKVSELSALTTTDGAEELLINDGGTSKKVTIANLLHDNSIDSDHYVNASIDNAHLADDAVGIDELSATGSAGSSTFLRGDNSWVTPTDTNTMGSGFTVSATTDSNATTITQGDDLLFTAGTGITCETTADGTVTITNTVSGASTATSSATGVIKIEDDTDQSVAAESVSTTANRTYGLQLNSSDQGVVNIPWTDTNTVNMGSGFTVSATTDTNATTITQGDDLMFTAGTGITCETTADGTVTITNTVADTTNDVVDDTSPQLGGFLDANGNYMQTEKGADIVSASPIVITTVGDYFDVTGTTNFAVMTVAADRQFTLQFDGVLTMTHHATNIDLPGEANITTAAGDVATFQSTGSNTVQCINYTRADGTAIVGASGVTLGFFEHTHTISSNLTITTDYNALSAGPITVASGYSVTVPSGSTWVIA